MYKNLAATPLAACVCAALSVSPVGAHTAASPPSPSQIKAAFVYVTPVLPAGWTHQHEQGRLELERSLATQVQTTVVQSVPEGADAERVIRDLAAQGHDIIFTTSFGYMEPTLRVAQAFAHVKFENITGYKQADNVATANVRHYEGRYLSGIAAGRMSQSGIAGFVAGYPIPEVIQGINAFALGMRSVNLGAQLKVIWLNTWFDPVRERDAAMALMDQGADVLSFQVASTAVMAAAQERGKMAIAFHSDMRKDGPDAQLLAVTHHWGAYYSQRVQALQSGTWQPADTWGGVQEGMVRVEHFGPKLPAAAREEMLARQKDMAAGELQPFCAVGSDVHDNRGQVRIAKGTCASDRQLQSMDWLVQGVIGPLP